jgi:hypothetical protein
MTPWRPVVAGVAVLVLLMGAVPVWRMGESQAGYGDDVASDQCRPPQ